MEQASPRTLALAPPPSYPAGFPWQPSSLGRKLEPGATGFLPKRPLAGGSALWPLWMGGLRKGGRCLPWQVGRAQPTVQLGLSAGLPSGLSLTRHSLDLKLARDLQLGMEAREPQRPSMEGVGSFPGERGWVRPGQSICLGRALGSDYPPPGDASFPQHLPFPLTWFSTCLCHAQHRGHECNRHFMFLSPRGSPSLCPFIEHTVSTCSVPSTGGTENGLDSPCPQGAHSLVGRQTHGQSQTGRAACSSPAWSQDPRSSIQYSGF